MKRRSGLFGAVALAASMIAIACTSTYLFDERRDEQLPLDRALVFDGEFCTPGGNDVIQPIKIVVAMDASQSMQVSDPGGTRAIAVVDLINSLPDEPEVYIAVMLFAGSTTSYLTKDAQGNDGFTQVTAFTDLSKLQLEAQILAYVNPSTNPNRDSTDFLKPLADIYSLISTDISKAQVAGVDAGSVGARYSVIFLSDGAPSVCQDPDLICNGSAPVTRIRDLRDLTADVRFHTVHIFNGTLSDVCDLDGGTGQYSVGGCTTYCTQTSVPIPCPALINNQDIDRLRRMAEAGNGLFRDFENNEPISFLNFSLGQLRRAYELKEFVVTNFSAPPASPPDAGDSDSDNLTDEKELAIGTDPWRKDTDGDGFSDGVEVHFGPPFNPAQIAYPDGGGLDPGCPVELRGVDTDCDGLLDCDEQLIGTNARRADSDDDGVPDAIEWQMGTQPASQDMDQDPDTDGISNRDEVRMHLNPLVADNTDLTVNGYRYELDAEGGPNADGSQCYHFRVENVSLAPTMADLRDAGPPPDGGTGKKAGFNDLMLSYAFVPSDDPSAHTVVKSVRVTTPRYPVGGIKSPPDGVVPISKDDFIEGCP